MVLNIAVVGLGRMGKRHVHTLHYRVPRARVVAVCTTEPHEIEWAKSNPEYIEFGIAVYDDYNNMLASQADLHAVWVSTSTDVHAAQSLNAIEKGLHVLCEKPISTDLAEAQSVVDAAKANPRLKVITGFSRRFDASYRDAAQKIQKGTIGKPFLVRSNTCDLKDETRFFVRYAARNGGIFVDCAIHDIDLTLWYMDNPVPKAAWVAGTLQHHPELAENNDVDNAVGIVEFWGGQDRITGTEGKVMVNVVPRANNVVVADKGGMRHEVQPEYWHRFEHAFALEANDFVDAVLNDKPVPVELETGMAVMKIGQALQHALLSGEVVRFDEKGQRLN
ncbi:hypothetical protein BDW66DRAFT_161962 [Aspergillus desertorum]